MDNNFYGPMTLEEQVLYMEIAVLLERETRQDRERARNARRTTRQRVERENVYHSQQVREIGRRLRRQIGVSVKNRYFNVATRRHASARVRRRWFPRVLAPAGAF